MGSADMKISWNVSGEGVTVPGNIFRAYVKITKISQDILLGLVAKDEGKNYLENVFWNEVKTLEKRVCQVILRKDDDIRQLKYCIENNVLKDEEKNVKSKKISKLQNKLKGKDL